MSVITPTRAALLELEEERRAMGDGYRFLDEKRLLLAGEMVRELARYEAAAGRVGERLAAAATALRAALERHGLEGLEVHPAVPVDALAVHVEAWQLLGVPLVSARLVAQPRPAAPALDPSPEGERCREAFLALVEAAAEQAAVAGNLERLHREYRRTERRARALEDVLIPELGRTIDDLGSRLEAIEQEEATRVRRR
jgi:V/A-type H+-transporting ATPase subunit D